MGVARCGWQQDLGGLGVGCMQQTLGLGGGQPCRLPTWGRACPAACPRAGCSRITVLPSTPLPSKQVEEALALGRATLGKIRQNLAWALAYNCVGIPLAAGALLPAYGVALDPSTAAGLMAFSSVAVVSNSLLLRRAAEQLPGAPAPPAGAVGSTTQQPQHVPAQ